jgi:hypothetical protein
MSYDRYRYDADRLTGLIRRVLAAEAGSAGAADGVRPWRGDALSGCRVSRFGLGLVH